MFNQIIGSLGYVIVEFLQIIRDCIILVLPEIKYFSDLADITTLPYILCGIFGFSVSVAIYLPKIIKFAKFMSSKI